MSLQIVHNEKGKATGVFIPIRECKEIKKQNKRLVAMENSDNKTRLLQEIKEAIMQLRLIEVGKLSSRPAIELLDEL
jgi:hypothetical protein